MLIKFLPRELRKYFLMSKRQRKYEIALSLWYKPLLYVALAIAAAIITIFIDTQFNLPLRYTLFSYDFETTRTLMSTLIA